MEHKLHDSYFLADSIKPESRKLAVLSHLLGLLTGMVVPLILLIITDQSKPFVRKHAAEALNFQLTLVIVYFISFILSFFLVGIIGFIVFGLLDIVLSIQAAMKARKGVVYRYPFTIRLIRV